jgi:hypothetical protein
MPDQLSVVSRLWAWPNKPGSDLPSELADGVFAAVAANLTILVQDPTTLTFGAIFIAKTYGSKVFSSSLDGHSDSFRYAPRIAVQSRVLGAF